MWNTEKTAILLWRRTGVIQNCSPLFHQTQASSSLRYPLTQRLNVLEVWQLRMSKQRWQPPIQNVKEELALHIWRAEIITFIWLFEFTFFSLGVPWIKIYRCNALNLLHQILPRSTVELKACCAVASAQSRGQWHFCPLKNLTGKWTAVWGLSNKHNHPLLKGIVLYYVC